MRTYLRRITPPTQEPVALAELKRHLRQGAPADDLTPAISIAAGSHAIGAHNGTAITVTNKQPVFLLNAGACGVGGSVAVKLQHRDGADVWADVTGGTFTTVTEANHNTIQELAYTGIKASVRAVATVAGAACEFAVTVLLYDPVAEEDDLLLKHLKAARKYCEDFQERSYCEQVWEMTADSWPANGGDFKLERGPWISVDSVKYTDYAGTAITLTKNTDYVISLARGIIRLAYGKSWPSAILHVIDPIAIRFTTGMATVSSDVINAILLYAGWLALNKGDDPALDENTIKAVHRLLWADSWGVPFA